jgi:hypothetical protein
VDWQTILTGIGAVLTGAGGCVLVIHEFRRRDRLALKRELDDLSNDVSELRVDVVALRRYNFFLAQELAALGYEPPPAPPSHTVEEP